MAWATGDLVALVGPLLDVSEHRRLSLPAETIVLRSRLDKAVIDYQETADTTAMREQVAVVNEGLSRLDLRQFGKRIEIPIGRRIFNGSFERGGRFYCHGASFQNMRARHRRDLECMIDGVLHPMVEIDYSTLHITMAYTEAGAKVPRGDLYAIEGFDRRLVKIAVNIMFNAENRRSAVLAIAKALHDDTTLCVASGVPDSPDMVELTKHSRRDSWRPSNTNIVESRTTSTPTAVLGSNGWTPTWPCEVMTRMIQRTGRCPLPIHDSFLVADIDAEDLRQTMKEVATTRRSEAQSQRIQGHLHHHRRPHRRPITTGSPSTSLPKEHHPTDSTTPCTSISPAVSKNPNPRSSPPSTPHGPTPGIQLEVTTPDLQGQKRPNGSNEPRHESRKREIDTHYHHDRPHIACPGAQLARSTPNRQASSPRGDRRPARRRHP